MIEHRHFISTDYQCSRECPAYGLTMHPTALVHLDTPADITRAIQAYPHHWRMALEGYPHYWRMILETHFAFAFLAVTPWRLLTNQGDPQ